MKQRIQALRYLVSALAVSAALSLVGFAQQAAGQHDKMMHKADHSAHTTAMIADWTRAKEFTKEYLDAMPEDGVNYKPTPDIRSFAEQFLHLAAGNFGFTAQATGATNPYQGKNLEKMDEFKTKAGLTKVVLESYDFVIAGIKGMDMSKADEAIKLFGRFDSTRVGALAKCFEHQTHHRGQTTIYLRMKGVKPPNEKLF